MSTFPRIAIGYHGCLEPLASRLLGGDMDLREWKLSKNDWDWLGHGIYFWEGAPQRALSWAEDKARKKGGKPAVIGAIIDLSECFDLTDERFTGMLRITYEQVQRTYAAEGRVLPENRGGFDSPRRELDCLILNDFFSRLGPSFTAVRAPFWEGHPPYPGAMIRQRSHLQIAVRERSCILGVFRPTLSM